MSTQARASLAFALAWAGGFGTLADLDGPLALGLAAATAGLVWRLTRGVDPDRPRCHVGSEPSWLGRARASILTLALVAIAALLARSLARVLVEVPAAAWTALALALALALARWRPLPLPRVVAGLLACSLAVVAGLAGARFELAAPLARGALVGSPIIGVHPRQAIALSIDGFGPHDIITDDYVDPPGGMGYDPERWAARLELELHTLAATHYAAGPARAREAFGHARVEAQEALVPEADAGAYASRLGVRIESGTAGEGSMVQAFCPGSVRGPRASPPLRSTHRACPRKYLVDGSSGLGLSPRWPGTTELRGSDRTRLARVLDRSRIGASLDAAKARAVELGLLTLGLVIAALTLARRPELPALSHDGALAVIPVVAALALLTLALVDHVPASAPTRAGTTLLAIALLAAGAVPEPHFSGERAASEPAATTSRLGGLGLLALLAACPLGGSGDAVDLLDAIVEHLVLDLGASWSTARALAGSAAVLGLGAGLGACVGCLVTRPTPGDRERRHTREALSLVLVVALAFALSLRKPGDDAALLGGAAAMLVASTLPPTRRSAQWLLGLLCALGGLASAVGPTSPVALALVALAAGLCLVAATARGPEHA